MSLHRSFLAGRSGGRHKNVLSRVDRLAKLQAEGKWSPEEDSVYGLPKVANRKLVGKK
ncbi:MAG: small basic protein [Planctomycetes bacterium]|nr:small basic protein [Planctomycetota bacterium]